MDTKRSGKKLWNLLATWARDQSGSSKQSREVLQMVLLESLPPEEFEKVAADIVRNLEAFYQREGLMEGL